MLKELSYAVQQSFSLLNGLNHKDFSYKPDGSIVTSADKIIEKHLIKQIKILDPKGLIISEESEFNYKWCHSHIHGEVSVLYISYN